jgi:hypothetical protein
MGGIQRMADFGRLTLTQGGRALFAKTMRGKKLPFFRVRFGDGNLPKGQTIYDLSAMVHCLHNLPIRSKTEYGAGTATIKAILSNEGLKAGFWIREIGLFTKDPDGGPDVLYAYHNAGDKADYIPGGGSDMVKYHLSFTVANHVIIGPGMGQTGGI